MNVTTEFRANEAKFRLPFENSPDAWIDEGYTDEQDGGVGRVGYATQEEQRDFCSRLNDFVRLYAFLAQVLPFAETDWLFAQYGRGTQEQGGD